MPPERRAHFGRRAHNLLCCEVGYGFQRKLVFVFARRDDGVRVGRERVLHGNRGDDRHPVRAHRRRTHAAPSRRNGRGLRDIAARPCTGRFAIY